MLHTCCSTQAAIQRSCSAVSGEAQGNGWKWRSLEPPSRCWICYTWCICNNIIMISTYYLDWFSINRLNRPPLTYGKDLECWVCLIFHHRRCLTVITRLCHLWRLSQKNWRIVISKVQIYPEPTKDHGLKTDSTVPQKKGTRHYRLQLTTTIFYRNWIYQAFGILGVLHLPQFDYP